MTCQEIACAHVQYTCDKCQAVAHVQGDPTPVDGWVQIIAQPLRRSATAVSPISLKHWCGTCVTNAGLR